MRTKVRKIALRWQRSVHDTTSAKQRWCPQRGQGRIIQRQYDEIKEGTMTLPEDRPAEEASGRWRHCVRYPISRQRACHRSRQG